MGYYLLLLLVITLLCSRLHALSYHSIHWCSISSRLGPQRCYSSINSSGNSGVGEKCSVCNIIILTPTQTFNSCFSETCEFKGKKFSRALFSVYNHALCLFYKHVKAGLAKPGNRNVLMLHSIMISDQAGQGWVPPLQTGDQCFPSHLLQPWLWCPSEHQFFFQNTQRHTEAAWRNTPAVCTHSRQSIIWINKGHEGQYLELKLLFPFL